MKTWEMIKELTEDDTKKYKLINTDNNDSLNGIVTVIDSIICWEVGDGFPMFVVVSDNDANWEEVITPVDFITAYNNCKETGQSYKCEDQEQIMKLMSTQSGECVSIIDSEYEEVTTMRLDVEWVKYD